MLKGDQRKLKGDQREVLKSPFKSLVNQYFINCIAISNVVATLRVLKGDQRELKGDQREVLRARKLAFDFSCKSIFYELNCHLYKAIKSKTKY